MDESNAIDLSNGALDAALDAGAGLRQARLGLPGRAGWGRPGSAGPVFAVHYDGARVDGESPGLTVRGVEESALADGSRRVTVRLAHGADGLEIDVHEIVYAGTPLSERWLTVRNAGARPLRIERLDSVVLDIPEGDYELRSYTSAWGLEFEEVRAPLAGGEILETRQGRSSNQQHPWFALVRPEGDALSASVAWSGNWAFRFERLPEGGYRIGGGLHDWEFFKDLAPGEAMESPPVVVALGARPDLNDLSAHYARVGRTHWYPRNALSDLAPTEWNHWFPYIDKHIDEDVFKQNVDAAARMGIEVCTLDAGWFGPIDPDTHWYDYRGDWELINTARFPGGIRALSDYTHERGMKFGLWCEIEGLGHRSRLAQERPDLPATRDGEPWAIRKGQKTGYVCFGNPAAQEWAFATLDRIVTEYACDWIKLDFNVDPGAGCNRTDHGHGAGDGLYEHYRGYYRVLERVRERHPQVVLESCSSGGLRIDLGLMRRTFPTFLSDPDWPEHDLQIFWGASTMLAPEACLHWGWCEWAGNQHPHQTFDPCDPALTRTQLDYYVRSGMLGAFGYSQKLPDVPEWVAERFGEHVRDYKETVRRFVKEGDLYRLTEQPKREGQGDRWAGFQYALPDGSEHLLFVFRLHGGEPGRTLRPQGLDPARLYTVVARDAGTTEQRTGADLMNDGLRFANVPEEWSEIVTLR